MKKTMILFLFLALATLLTSGSAHSESWRKMNIPCGVAPNLEPAPGEAFELGSTLNDIAVASPTTLYVVGGGPIIGGPSVICKSEDRGENWTELPNPTEEPLYAIDCMGASICFAVGSAGKILKTNTGGATWSVFTATDTRDIFPGPDPNPTFWDVRVVPGTSTVIAVGDLGNIWRSTNAGFSWVGLNTPNIPEDFSTILNAVHFGSSTTGMIVGLDRTALQTTNAGANWEPVVVPEEMSPSLAGVFGLSASNFSIQDTAAFMRREGGVWGPRVIISTDGWINIPFSDHYFVSNSVGYAIGGPGGGIIRKSIDGGASWPNFFPGVTDPATLSDDERRILEDITVLDSEGNILTLIANLKDVEF